MEVPWSWREFTDSAESMESGEESEGLDSSDVEQEGLAGVGMCVGTAGMDAVVPQGPAGIDAVRPLCMCLMADCVTCQGVTVAAAIGPQAHQHKRKCKQKHELPPGHSKCSLREELEIDAGRHQGVLWPPSKACGDVCSLVQSVHAVVTAHAVRIGDDW